MHGFLVSSFPQGHTSLVDGTMQKKGLCPCSSSLPLTYQWLMGALCILKEAFKVSHDVRPTKTRLQRIELFCKLEALLRPATARFGRLWPAISRDSPQPVVGPQGQSVTFTWWALLLPLRLIYWSPKSEQERRKKRRHGWLGRGRIGGQKKKTLLLFEILVASSSPMFGMSQRERETKRAGRCR